MKTAIFDMDGTLANIDHRIKYLTDGHPDWESFNSLMVHDKANIDMCDLAKMLSNYYRIVICTGRFDKFRNTTEQQLHYWGVPHSGIFMRPEGDYSSDVDVKRKHLKYMRDNEYNPMIAFEDRKRVVDMWREEGLTCFQINDGDF